MSKHDVLPYLRALEGFNARWLEDEAFVAEVEDLLEGEHPALEEAAWAEAAIEDKLAAARSVLAPYRTQTGAPIRHVFGELAAGQDVQRDRAHRTRGARRHRGRPAPDGRRPRADARQRPARVRRTSPWRQVSRATFCSPPAGRRRARTARASASSGTWSDAVMRRGPLTARPVPEQDEGWRESSAVSDYATCPIRRAPRQTSRTSPVSSSVRTITCGSVSRRR